MSETATFRTKTGHAVVTSQRLVLERAGARGMLAETLYGRSKGRARAMNGLVLVLLACLGFDAWRDGRVVFAAYTCGLALWIGVTMVRSRDFSAATELPRADTTRVRAVRGWRGLTRDRLVVHFSEHGRLARRFIPMPGVTQEGAGELDRALRVLADAGWPVDEADARRD